MALVYCAIGLAMLAAIIVACVLSERSPGPEDPQ